MSGLSRTRMLKKQADPHRRKPQSTLRISGQMSRTMQLLLGYLEHHHG
jgi:hypothetical protein